MNRDQVKGRVKEVVGKVEKNVGHAVGSTKTEAKGIAKDMVPKGAEVFARRVAKKVTAADSVALQ